MPSLTLPCVQPCHIGSLTHPCRACSLATLAHSHTIAVRAALPHWLTHTPLPCVQPCHIGSLTYHCRACGLVTLAHSHTHAVRTALSHWLTHIPLPCVQPCHIGSLTHPCRACSLYDYPKQGTPFKRGDRYYYYYNSGLQQQWVHDLCGCACAVGSATATVSARITWYWVRKKKRLYARRYNGQGERSYFCGCSNECTVGANSGS